MDGDTLVFVDVVGFPGGNLTPVRAAHEHGSCYQLLESSSDPEHFVWAFERGTTVRCERREFSEGEFDLVAVGSCTCTADSRKP
jgi:hypothetical protein